LSLVYAVLPHDLLKLYNVIMEVISFSTLWEYSSNSIHSVHVTRMSADRGQSTCSLPLHQTSWIHQGWPENGNTVLWEVTIF